MAHINVFTPVILFLLQFYQYDWLFIGLNIFDLVKLIIKMFWIVVSTILIRWSILLYAFTVQETYACSWTCFGTLVGDLDLYSLVLTNLIIYVDLLDPIGLVYNISTTFCWFWNKDNSN